MKCSTSSAAVRGVLATVRGLVAGLDPGSVPDGEVAGMWGDFDAVERLALAGKTLLARRVAECEIWRREGYRSAADHMAAIAGSSVTGARSVLATSKRLVKLPATEAALRGGGLSGVQVDRIADAATVNPGAEQRLLAMVGSASLRELADECGRAKAAGDRDPDKTYRRIHRNRRLNMSRDAEGAWRLLGSGTVDAGAVFASALEEIIDELFAQARAEGREETRERLAFDALIELARRATEHDWDLDDDSDLDDDVTADDADASGWSDGGEADRDIDTGPATEPQPDLDSGGEAGVSGMPRSGTAGDDDRSQGHDETGAGDDAGGRDGMGDRAAVGGRPNRAQRRSARRKRPRRSRNQEWLGLVRSISKPCSGAGSRAKSCVRSVASARFL